MSIPQRRGAAATTVIGIAGVVAVLVGVLSIAVGFQKVMAASGSPDGVMVLRSGATSEMESGLGREDIRLIGDTALAWRGQRRGRFLRRSYSSSSTCPNARPALMPTSLCAAWK